MSTKQSSPKIPYQPRTTSLSPTPDDVSFMLTLKSSEYCVYIQYRYCNTHYNIHKTMVLRQNYAKYQRLAVKWSSIMSRAG